MTMVVPCVMCERMFEVSDLYTVTAENPEYEDLPEPTPDNYVDVRDEETGEKVLRLRYCERCIGMTALPPLSTTSDMENAPEPYEP